MALKYEIDTIDGLDESVAALYEKAGDKYRLSVDGLPKGEDVAGLWVVLRQVAETHLLELQQALEQLRRGGVGDDGPAHPHPSAVGGAHQVRVHPAGVQPVHAQRAATAPGQHVAPAPAQVHRAGVQQVRHLHAGAGAVGLERDQLVQVQAA